MGPVASQDAAMAAVETAFKEFEEEKADIYEMGKIAKVGGGGGVGGAGCRRWLMLLVCALLQACGCPLYWKAPMFFSAGGERTGFVSVHSFLATWRK